ncbi:MAG: hypothetical protein ACJ786_25855, partial [Catenulispora sp.]
MAPRRRRWWEHLAAPFAPPGTVLTDDVTDGWESPGADDVPLSLTASARTTDLKVLAKRRKGPEEAEWQAEAWHHYGRSGELQYAAAWMANSLSRIRLYAAEVGEDGRPGKPTDNAKAKQIAADLFGGPALASQAMASLGVQLVVPGDCWVIIEEQPAGERDLWTVVATSELKKKDGKLGLEEDSGFRPLDENKTLLIRIWNPHPRRRGEATSATRSVLPVLRELEKLDQHVHATLESRLPAGILFVPDSIDFLSPDPEIQAASGSTGALMGMLTGAMMAAVEDRSSPASLVPLLAKVPPDALAQVQHLTFGADLIERIAEMREAGIRRLALGLDMPPEQLLGLGDSNHWSSWQIEEGGVKVHVEPKVLLIAAALTETYFRPALKAAGIANPEDYILWYDVSDLVLRPNRSEAAKDLHTVGSLSDAVLMREAGFDPEVDRPDEDEFRRRTLIDLLGKKPDFAPQILPALGITDVDLTPEPAPADRPGTGRGSGREPAKDDPKKNPQDPDKGNPGAPTQPKTGSGPAQKPRDDKPKERDKWSVVSTSEFKKKDNKLGIAQGEGEFHPLDLAKTLLIRVW